MNSRRRQRKGARSSRWEIQRERCRISDASPPPPDLDPRTLAPAIDAVIKKLGLEKRRWVEELTAEWPTLVGAAVAGHSRPGIYDNKRLVVFVDSSAWLAELSRFSKGAMLRNLQERFGATRIQSIDLRIDPDRGRGGPRR